MTIGKYRSFGDLDLTIMKKKNGQKPGGRLKFNLLIDDVLKVMISPVDHGALRSPLSSRGRLLAFSDTGAWCRRNSPSSTFEEINDLELEELLELSLDNDIKCIAIKQALHKSPRSRGDTEQ